MKRSKKLAAKSAAKKNSPPESAPPKLYRPFEKLAKDLPNIEMISAGDPGYTQALEFTDGKLVLYGLGNLYFDQMWSQATRENMIVKHTIYQGRHISTQIMTTLLYDYGQPRWMTPDQRTSLLKRVFDASYW